LPLYEPLVAGLLGAALAHWTQRSSRDAYRREDALRLTLRVTPAPAGYRVAVVEAPEGVTRAEAAASLPLDEPLAGGPTLAHGLKQMARGAADAKTREAVGRHLFGRLFPGPVAEAYRASRRRAHRMGWRPRGLQVR